MIFGKLIAITPCLAGGTGHFAKQNGAPVSSLAQALVRPFVGNVVYSEYMNSYDNQRQIPKITHVPAGDIICYEVYEHELDQIASGSQNHIYLDFAIGLLGVAFTLLAALVTFPAPASNKVFMAFCTLCIIGFIGGFLLMILWLRSRKSQFDILKIIKSRLKPLPPR